MKKFRLQFLYDVIACEEKNEMFPFHLRSETWSDHRRNQFRRRTKWNIRPGPLRTVKSCRCHVLARTTFFFIYVIRGEYCETVYCCLCQGCLTRVGQWIRLLTRGSRPHIRGFLYFGFGLFDNDHRMNDRSKVNSFMSVEVYF